MISALFPSLFIPLALSGVEVRGATECPTAGDVSRRILPLLAPEAALPATDHIELADVPAARPGAQDLEVRLARSGVDQPLGVRRIRGGAPCAEMADAVAVVAATWIGQYLTRPAPLPALPAPLPPPPLAPARPVETARAGDTAFADGTAAPLSVRRSAARADPAPSASAPSWEWGIGAATGAVASARGGAAPLFQAEGEARLNGGWMLRLTGAGAGTRSIDFSGGQAGWQRFVLLPTVGYSWRRSGLFAETAVGFAGALLRAHGQGFSTNASDTSVDLGVAGSVRVGARLGRLPVLLWVSPTAVLWARAQQAVVDGQSNVQTLPRQDVSLTAGLTFLLRQ